MIPRILSGRLFKMLIHSPRDLALLVVSQRKKLSLSQAAVGDLIGIKQATVSAFENRPENTKMDTVFRILAAVNLDIYSLAKDKILTGKDEWKEEW